MELYRVGLHNVRDVIGPSGSPILVDRDRWEVFRYITVDGNTLQSRVFNGNKRDPIITSLQL